MTENSSRRKIRIDATEDRIPPKRYQSPAVWAGAGIGVAVAALLLAVDIFPIITNDSLAYIGHSNSLVQTGLVQFGYRQVGYPAFLAVVDLIAGTFRLEPLLLTVLLQRILYLSALAFGAWLWRWRALPLLFVAIIPSLVVYTNFILTEGLGIGLALWYAMLVAWIMKMSKESSAARTGSRTRTAIAVAIAVVALIFFALVVIRFQYVLMMWGLLVVLCITYRRGDKLRIAAGVTALTILVAVSSVLVLQSLENDSEWGSFSPSVRGERSRFWAAWQVTFSLDPENRDDQELADLYANGDPYKVMYPIDALPTYAEQQEAYVEAMNQLVHKSGSSWVRERIGAFVGVLQGGRIDDVSGIVKDASQTRFDTIEEAMYRAAPVRKSGVGYFTDRYNDGRRVQPVIFSPLAPVRSAPYFTLIYRWLLVATMGVLLVGMFDKDTRTLSVVGLLTLLTTASVFGFFLMDNVRFIVVPLLFVVATAIGVTDAGWRQFLASRE